MQVGKKGTGQEMISKMIVARHGNGSKQKVGASRSERIIERRVRRAGKKIIQQELDDR